MSRKGLFSYKSFFDIVAKKGSYQNKLFLSLWSTMIYIDPSQTAESLGACVTWCIRLMSEKEFLELVSTILDPSVWESVPETAEDKHQQFVSISYLCLRLLEEYGEGVVRDIVLNVVMDIHHPLCLINMLTEERARIFSIRLP